MLSNVVTAKAISGALLSSYQKHQLRCDHSVTISQLNVQFRNRVVTTFVWCIRQLYILA